MNDRYLQKIKSFYAKFRRLPTYTEMLDLLGFASRNAVHWVVKKWIGQGILEKQGNRLSPTPDFFGIPLLGIIPAGSPTTNELPIDETLSLDDYFFSNPGYIYALRVSGDSMKDEGIHEGDLVILDRKREPKSGDIVAALIDNEWTLKYFNKNAEEVYLTAANPKYNPFHPRESLLLGGVVVKVIKEYY